MLEHKYLTPKNSAYNVTHLRTSVHRNQYVEDYRFPKQPRFSLFQKQMISLFVIAASLFLLAFEVGWIDYLEFLFR